MEGDLQISIQEFSRVCLVSTCDSAPLYRCSGSSSSSSIGCDHRDRVDGRSSGLRRREPWSRGPWPLIEDDCAESGFPRPQRSPHNYFIPV